MTNDNEVKPPRHLLIKSIIIDKKSSIPVMDYWNDIRIFIDHLEMDAFNSGVKHQFSAGVRFRHGLRELHRKIRLLINLSNELDKEARSKKRNLVKGTDPHRFYKHRYKKIKT